MRERAVPRLARAGRLAVAGLLGAAAARLGRAPELPATPAAIVAELLRRPAYPRAWFAPEMLDALPPARLARLAAGLTAEFGPLREVRPNADGHVAELERGFVPVKLARDRDGRVAAVRFATPSPRLEALADAPAAFAGLPGAHALLVRRDGAAAAAAAAALAVDADRPMPAGSAFKLAVLKALKDRVAAGALAWTDLVPLEPRWRALPSGQLHEWPEGLALTVETLACLMISVSDNTATTALIDLAGRDALEAAAPHARPFLTPRELFLLKSAGAADLRRRYLAADLAGRRAVLRELEGAEPPRGADALVFGDPELEWRFAAEELAALVEDVADLPAVRINPGLAEKSDWRSVAFKGGSDVGVLSLTTRLEARDGTAWTVVAIWNADPPLKADALYAPYGAVLDLLRRGSAPAGDG